ncbi:GNAT family N-acetyltransferase [Sedimentitalea sp. CY04]|uniref:GNAT family N-acetyltransferase n=1 Tax=Parasedimentitalea denitrificans TaxID=2211118 RepID=A0ABX0W510_9RHOB|nr:GNAT family N-acetyltransferase [Sedimentitalea sp. CY04]NIZ60729.1 GNAT family N-acetyltransferase [Sedimentitalea sp. CY04]
MRLQVATSDESELVARFVAALLTELTGGELVDPAELEPTTSRLLGRDDVIGILAYDQGEPVGIIMLNECAAIYAGGIFGEITELYVLPEMRSKGVATRLVKEACATGKRRRWKRLEVGAPDQPAWKRTMEFYQGNGFAEVGPRLRKLIA